MATRPRLTPKQLGAARLLPMSRRLLACRGYAVDPHAQEHGPGQLLAIDPLRNIVVSIIVYYPDVYKSSLRLSP
jgi:hypothetical protein